MDCGLSAFLDSNEAPQLAQVAAFIGFLVPQLGHFFLKNIEHPLFTVSGRALTSI